MPQLVTVFPCVYINIPNNHSALLQYSYCFEWHNILSLFIQKQFFLKKPTVMLSWSAGFLIIAIIAAVFGYVVIAGSAAFMAKIFFFIFIILFVLSLFFQKSTS